METTLGIFYTPTDSSSLVQTPPSAEHHVASQKDMSVSVISAERAAWMPSQTASQRSSESSSSSLSNDGHENYDDRMRRRPFC